jgi:hypothetical protein
MSSARFKAISLALIAAICGCPVLRSPTFESEWKALTSGCTAAVVQGQQELELLSYALRLNTGTCAIQGATLR